MGKQGWQAVAFTGVALSFLLGGFAYNTKRELEAAYAAMRSREPNSVEQCTPTATVTRPEDAPEIPYAPGAFDPAPAQGSVMRQANDRCINGALIRNTGREWINIGNC